MDKAELTGSFGSIELLGDASSSVDRILAIVGHINLFEDFSHEDIENLARYMRCCRVGPGVELIREGETGDFMLLVLEGTVEIVKIDPRGMPQRLAMAGPGKTLGEMSLIDGEPRFASCLTLEPTVFAVLDRDSLANVISDEPRIGVKILMELLMLLNQRLRAVSGDLMKCLENQRLRIR
ncbi:MAG: cyclic nucleotide-binding domain-containing protein [Rhodocyclaceae bacterium]|nr:cyclic nucleotide-binding domain-containing protein [Rhodocyclaceae bacterium]MDZ4213762.1 cyclic nucleotide-binding domain-containing protein [Rhodocyclaceae bacterium]